MAIARRKRKGNDETRRKSAQRRQRRWRVISVCHRRQWQWQPYGSNGAIEKPKIMAWGVRTGDTLFGAGVSSRGDRRLAWRHRTWLVARHERDSASARQVTRRDNGATCCYRVIDGTRSTTAQALAAQAKTSEMASASSTAKIKIISA
jgi:hypothetical protein